MDLIQKVSAIKKEQQMFKRFLSFLFILLFSLGFVLAQTNPKHVRVSGYTRKDGTYVRRISEQHQIKPIETIFQLKKM